MRRIFLPLAVALALTACGSKPAQAVSVASAEPAPQETAAASPATVSATGEDDDFIEQTLPNTAERQDENDVAILYSNLDIAESDVHPAQTSVWLVYKKSGKVRALLNSCDDALTHWEEMDGNGIVIPDDEIVIGELYSCKFLPWDPDKILVEGCPDGRNVWSYIFEISSGVVIQLPSTEGLLYFDTKRRHLCMSHYDYYPEGGRYSIMRAYTDDGRYTGIEEKLEDE